ncbi:hypothetical protein ACFE04_001555 [Oxalis oulophora]
MSMIEERSEKVVSLNGDGFTKVVSMHEQIASIPSIPISTNTQLLLPLKVVFFNGRQTPPLSEKWKSWVQSMHSKQHHHTWIKAGIEKSILSSIYQHMEIHNELIVALTDKWCPKTNTFIFPWGETTITLEDMFVLGGFSLLGHSVTINNALYDADMLRIQQALFDSWTKPTRKCTHHSWINYFMDTGMELEHQVFLVLWLSRFVFPRTVVSVEMFPIAIQLSKGFRLALAPAVLADIYRELGLLKDYISSSGKVSSGDNRKPLFLCAPFQLLQVWVWERFPSLSPTPGLIQPGEPRVARWDKIHKLVVQDIGFALNSSGGNFQWRPYAATLSNWQPPPAYYGEVGSKLPNSSVIWMLGVFLMLNSKRSESNQGALREAEQSKIQCKVIFKLQSYETGYVVNGGG